MAASAKAKWFSRKLKCCAFLSCSFETTSATGDRPKGFRSLKFWRKTWCKSVPAECLFKDAKGERELKHCEICRRCFGKCNDSRNIKLDEEVAFPTKSVLECDYIVSEVNERTVLKWEQWIKRLAAHTNLHTLEHNPSTSEAQGLQKGYQFNRHKRKWGAYGTTRMCWDLSSWSQSQWHMLMVKYNILDTFSKWSICSRSHWMVLVMQIVIRMSIGQHVASGRNRIGIFPFSFCCALWLRVRKLYIDFLCNYYQSRV